nr:hypothetical protein WG33_0260 [uncultured bacterium]
MPSSLAQVRHGLVVGRVVGDVAGPVRLLEAADAVLEARRARERPRPGQRLGVSLVGVVDGVAGVVGAVGLRGESGRDVGQGFDVGQLPGLGAVGQVAVGQQEHRRAVLERDPARLDRGVEAARRRGRRHDRHG